MLINDINDIKLDIRLDIIGIIDDINDIKLDIKLDIRLDIIDIVDDINDIKLDIIDIINDIIKAKGNAKRKDRSQRHIQRQG